MGNPNFMRWPQRSSGTSSTSNCSASHNWHSQNAWSKPPVFTPPHLYRISCSVLALLLNNYNRGHWRTAKKKGGHDGNQERGSAHRSLAELHGRQCLLLARQNYFDFPCNIWCNTGS